MALLDKRPTWFVKDGVRRAAYYTVQATELREAGFVEEGEPAKVYVPKPGPPEVPVEAGGDAFEVVAEPEEEKEEDELAPRRRGRRKKAESDE